ncbi:hypothetical protein [Autumnicola musiva]|uniref:Secreted protein n=1 Tax=Autumnicola musiva TaxID=3075589 RepID=A0ABU3D282_9FLAO|nr:hypothetical protein [Zunongwangia sp. F117]MDT0675644.1 hypothetical protein [Zunongwangia sp. F117]
MKKLLSVFLLICSFASANAQDLNDYQYVIVPESFEFSDSKNEYQLNALTKFLLEKYGFKTVMKSADKSAVLQGDPCRALYADVSNDSGLFVTKLKLVLKDCYDKVVYESPEGRSREKDFKVAYQEALRNAFSSLEEQGYEYNNSVKTQETEDMNGEVAVETPESEQEVVPQEQEDREVEIKKEVSADFVAGKYFVLDNAEYYLEKTGEGYSFHQKGMAEPFAALIKSEKDNSFIYSSVTKQGLAYFDNAGNLVVEYFDRNQNKTVKSVYALQD